METPRSEGYLLTIRQQMETLSQLTRRRRATRQKRAKEKGNAYGLAEILQDRP
jgi:hypothetical protein